MHNMTPISDKYSNPLSPSFMSRLQHMTTEELMDLYQREAANPSGDIRLTVILGMLKKREKTAQQVREMPETTVADDIVQRAASRPAMTAQSFMPQQPQPQPEPTPAPEPVMSAATGGVIDLDIPEHMFQAKHMAGGGIVSFASGGVPTLEELQSMTPEELQNLPDDVKREIYLAQQRERAKFSPQGQQALRDAGQLSALQADEQGIETVNPDAYLLPGGLATKARYFMPRYGPAMAGKAWTIPQRGFTGMGRDIRDLTASGLKYIAQNPKKSAALAGVTSLFGLSDNEPATKPRMAFPEEVTPPAGTRTPAAGMTSEQALQSLNQNADILERGVGRAPTAPAGPGGSRAPGAGITGLYPMVATPTSEDSDMAGAEKFATRFLGPKPEEISYDKAKQETMDRLKEFGFDPDYIKKQADELDKSRKKLGDEKAFATNMRIIEAGLGIASGASPNAFVNLKGAIPALQGLGQDINKINALDRDIDKEKRSLAIEQNKLAQGLASASEAKVEKSKERLAEYFKTRGTITAQVYNNINSNRVKMAGDLLQAQTSLTTAGMQAQTQRDVANIYANPKEDKLTADVITKINTISSSDEARKDSDIIAMEKLPGVAKNATMMQKINAAKAREAERQRLIQGLRSQLPAGMQTSIAPQAASGRVVTMAQVNDAAAKTGKSVEQVLADARSKGYIIQ